MGETARPDSPAASASSTLVRRDIWLAEEAGGTWNDLVLAYALAFGELSNDRTGAGRPESWTLTYQAAVHDMQPLPPPNDLRATCQHDTWYFLPWHRMYLYHFEAVIRAILATMTDPRITDEARETWALPYWNYQKAAHRALPTAFREATLPDGAPNPLAQANRFPAVQTGSQPLVDTQVDYAGWWEATDFSLQGTPSFGGSDAGRRHRPNWNAPAAGDLEITPHGSVHMYVGPDMQSFVRAGFDPIFWLHHCNLDRLWEVWCLGGGTPRPNPTGGGWDSETFTFLAADGTEWTGASKDVEDTTALGYTYEDTAAPTATPVTTRGRAMPQPGQSGERWKRELSPRALGSTDTPFVVQSEAESADISLQLDDEVTTRAARPAPARLILQVDNIELQPADLARVEAGEAVIGSYSLYLVGTRPGTEAYVGNLPMFGLRESLSDDRHQLSYSFDATAAVDLLRNEAAWSWERTSVRVEPINHEAYEGAAVVAPITIGNVTVSYQ